jgi:CBS domain-containing protein
MLPPRLTATSGDSLMKLTKDMIEFEISLVPVVKSLNDQTVLGVVRLDDILRKISQSPKLSGLKVKDVMTKEVICCSVDDEIPRVWDVMEKTRCSGLPVTRYERRGRATKVIGMITRSDIIRSGAIRLAEESDKGRFRSPPRVKGLMRTPAIVISPSASLLEAIELMLKRNIGRLPVVEAGDLVGILTRADAIRACLG